MVSEIKGQLTVGLQSKTRAMWRTCAYPIVNNKTSSCSMGTWETLLRVSSKAVVSGIQSIQCRPIRPVQPMKRNISTDTMFHLFHRFSVSATEQRTRQRLKPQIGNDSSQRLEVRVQNARQDKILASLVFRLPCPFHVLGQIIMALRH